MGARMAATWGDLLRLSRKAAGLSQGQLAERVYVSKAEVGHWETGARRAHRAAVVQLDDALGVTPLLSIVAAMTDSEGDAMRRRALLTAATAAAGIGGLAGMTALAEVARAGFGRDAAGDWDALVADYARRATISPGPEHGAQILASLLLAQQQLDADPHHRDAARAGAQLAQLYGLHCGDQGAITSARGWYRSAADLADRAGDRIVAQWVRARAANRSVYEGYTAGEAIRDAHAALGQTSAATAGAVEAYAALVHVHALRGDLASGRQAVAGMASVAERLPDADAPAGASARLASFGAYLECRIGPRQVADRAIADALPRLKATPVWHADARIYYGRALVRSGEVSDGLAYTLDAVTGLDADVRVLAVGVADVLEAVPPGYAGELRDELATYAAPGPGPWATIA